jgi:Concanavalin A-like lectin/glucanases superfamily
MNIFKKMLVTIDGSTTVDTVAEHGTRISPPSIHPHSTRGPWLRAPHARVVLLSVFTGALAACGGLANMATPNISNNGGSNSGGMNSVANGVGVPAQSLATSAPGVAVASASPSATPTATSRPAATSAPKLAAVAGTSSYASVVVADKPVAFYRMNETAGTIMADSSGNAKNGSYVAGYQLGQPALLGADGAATSVAFPSGYATSSATWTNQAVTAECWIKPSASDIAWGARIMSNAWSNNDGNGYMMWLSGATPAFNAGWNGAVSATAMTAGTSYHVVGTYDNATGATLYVNGVVAAKTMPGAIPAPQTGDYGGTTYIGALNAVGQAGLTQYFTGSISNCALYDHALSAVQIAAHYNAGLHPPVVSPVVSSVASLTFLNVGSPNTQTVSVTQAGYTGLFTAAVSGVNASAVTVSLSGQVISVTPQQPGAATLVITGGSGQTITIPVSVTVSPLTIQGVRR